MFLEPTLTNPHEGIFELNDTPRLKPVSPRRASSKIEKGSSQHGTKILIESWATLTRRLGAQGLQGGPLGLFRSHYEWLPITIGQHTVSGNWEWCHDWPPRRPTLCSFKPGCLQGRASGAWRPAFGPLGSNLIPTATIWTVWVAQVAK